MVPWLVMGFEMCVRVSLRRLEYRSASLVMVGGESLLVVRIWGEVLSHYTDGSAYVNILSGVLCPSTTLRAVATASSLCVTLVCNFTLPMCVLYPMLSLVCMMSSARCRRCLCEWWVQLSGPTAYLRIVLMLKALYVTIERIWSNLLASSARSMDANSARLIMCLSV